MANQIPQNPAPPNLPITPKEYEARYHDQNNNILRLYFNRLKFLLDYFITILTSAVGGAAFRVPYFSAYQDGQTALTTAIPNGTSTADIHVTDTSHFLAAGYVIIEQELIQYTGKTSTTFTGITRGVLGTTSGKSAHALGAYVTEAAAVTSTTAAPMLLDVITLSNAITCAAYDSKVYFEVDGIYNVQFSVQLLNYTGVIDDVRIWLTKNGQIVPFSAGVIEVPAQHASTPGAIIAGWNYVEQFAAGDYIELYWRSVTGETVIATYPQGTSPTRPTSPGLILTATFVSALPSA